jgi:hypothetical protein
VQSQVTGAQRLGAPSQNLVFVVVEAADRPHVERCSHRGRRRAVEGLAENQ